MFWTTCASAISMTSRGWSPRVSSGGTTNGSRARGRDLIVLEHLAMSTLRSASRFASGTRARWPQLAIGERLLQKTPESETRGCYGNANTKRLLPLLGRSSGVNWRKLAVVAARPVLTAMYCRPSTAKLIGKPETGDPRLISQSTSPVS